MRLMPLKTEKTVEVLEFLNDSFAIAKKKGKGLTMEEDGIRRFVLQKYPEHGRAPTAAEIGENLGMDEEKVREILGSLDKNDVLFLDPSGEIVGAYPFRNQSSYQVTLEGDGRKVMAMCAVDALGIPFMLKENAAIRSCCAYCGGRIEVTVRDGAIVSCFPGDVVVWAGRTCCSSKAAASVCNTLAFFCSADHLERRSDDMREGWALTLPEALYVGKKLFEDAMK
jgi:hypothetical protein